MPPKPPDGEPAPADAALPAAALAELAYHPFGAYVHVPFCASRCGYCDFNTYTATELAGGPDASTYVDTVAAEVRLARRVLGERDLPLATVFLGGGTPTLLPADELARVLSVLDGEFGLTPDVEVTTEANPESVDVTYLERIRAAGVNRISFGMQSARPHVLAALDRQHTPGRVTDVVGWARKAGFEHVNLDLIYGGPGESAADWAASLAAVAELEPDHVSAYALTVEDGTRLARKVRRGHVLPADDDLLADRYVQADEALTAAGLTCYEVSNWARNADARCRHNLGYWNGHHWWGFGPGAHSHVGGVRWWNVRHPSTYAERLRHGDSPADAREVLDTDARRTEAVMLGVRLADGLPVEALTPAGQAATRDLAADGLLDAVALASGRLLLTRRGRLLTDTVVRAVLPD